jgi:hypothetical protein
MKTLQRALLGIVIACAGPCVNAQGFLNLDFESANIPGSIPPGGWLIPFNDALPFWTGYFASSSGGYPSSEAAYDGISLGSQEFSIVDSSVGVPFYPLQGKYSAFLFGGGDITYYSATISQTGLVPSVAKTLFFDGRVIGAPFTVTLGGQTLDVGPIEVHTNYVLYGATISSFAGKTETLSFTEPAPGTGGLNLFELDDVIFSTEVIPEPGAPGFLVMGGLLLGLSRRSLPPAILRGAQSSRGVA